MGYIGVRSSSSDLVAFVRVAIVVFLLSALFSSPVLLLLPLASRWALNAPTLLSRRLRLALTVIALFGAFAVSTFLLARYLDKGPNNINIFWAAAPYLPAALVAAAYTYRPWLFRP
jgi:hypothetical protein